MLSHLVQKPSRQLFQKEGQPFDGAKIASLLNDSISFIASVWDAYNEGWNLIAQAENTKGMVATRCGLR